MIEAPDISDWIGRSRSSTDIVSPRLLSQFKVTLVGMLFDADVPPGLCWCLAPDLAAAEQLGRDGHPEPGLFLPRLPLPRRMWAGGEITMSAPLSPGDVVTRTSTVENVAFKDGRSGPLGFVTVAHRYEVGGEARILERQDIVYRENPRPGEAAAAPPEPEVWQPLRSWRVTPDETLLFRFSALTFNGHRIHYDQPYATGVEGYAGLVVHGPMQAVWLQNLAATILGRPAAIFSYRALAPLICGEAVSVEAVSIDDGIALRVRRERDNVVTMQATAKSG
jgi:3-methylfumaryl-CoA hydratase